MKDLKKRFKRESECFDRIAKKRYSHNQIPNLRAEFINEYFYNNIWRNSVFLRQEFGPRCKWIIDSLKKAGVLSVVELGCGNGWLSLELAREGFDVTGLDVSEKSISVARDYLNSLSEKKNLSLKYVCKNILDYEEYAGESVVCFGFLHHLPPQVFKKFIRYLSKSMNPDQMLLAVEPRYDHASYKMGTLIYALRLSLPNHFKYRNINSKTQLYINKIVAELSEEHRTQSEMDNESPSDLVVKVIKENFGKVNLRYCTSFFDKIIGSIRVDKKDIWTLSKLLKQLDEIIVKYNRDLSRVVMIKAERK